MISGRYNRKLSNQQDKLFLSQRPRGSSRKAIISIVHREMTVREAMVILREMVVSREIGLKTVNPIVHRVIDSKANLSRDPSTNPKVTD